MNAGELAAPPARASRAPGRAFMLLAVYLCVMHVLPFWQMVTGHVPRLFVIVDVLAAVIGLVGLRHLWRRLVTPPAGLSPLDLLVGTYGLWALASVALYFQEGHPAEFRAYYFGVHYVFVPLLGYFGVKALRARDQARLIRLIVWLNLALVTTGLMVFYWQPPFYTAYIIDHFKGEVTEMWQVYGRVNSYLGSTTVGIMAGVSLMLVDYVRTGAMGRAALCSVFAVAGLLSQQRGAYVAVFIGLVYQLAFRTGRLRTKLAWLTLLSVMLATIVLAYDRRNAALEQRLDLVEYTQNRLFNEAIGTDIFAERALGYRRGIENARQFPLGLGLGATLSASDSAGANAGGQVVDANYMRILSDLGIAGLLLFFGILVIALWRALQVRPRLLWPAVLTIHIIIAIGTNVLDSFYVSHVFWILLAVIDDGGAHGKAQSTE